MHPVASRPASHHTSSTLGQAIDFSQRGAKARSQAVVLARHAPPAGLPLAQPRPHEPGQTSPSGTEPCRRVRAGIYGQPPPQFAFDLRITVRRSVDSVLDMAQALPTSTRPL